jgi:phosphoglycolate phosphatase-like HAD superfamily hydrolase
MLTGYKVILWDFDGVLIDSNQIREAGFTKVLSNYPDSQVAELITFHRKNGGLSRYVKFRYFFEQIRNETVNDDEIINLSDRFSLIMRDLLLDSTLLIEDSISFLRNNVNFFDMHIVSGSDQNELRDICMGHGIDKYFITINGSPKSKPQLIREIFERYGYSVTDVVLIGDSINDYEAAEGYGIDFIGYNNKNLIGLSEYIYSFVEIPNKFSKS